METKNFFIEAGADWSFSLATQNEAGVAETWLTRTVLFEVTTNRHVLVADLSAYTTKTFESLTVNVPASVTAAWSGEYKYSIGYTQAGTTDYALHGKLYARVVSSLG